MKREDWVFAAIMLVAVVAVGGVIVFAVMGWEKSQRFEGACIQEGGTVVGTIGDSDLTCIDGDRVLFNQKQWEVTDQ